MTVEFPIDAMRIAPNGRPLDLSHVAGVALYRVGPEGPREFWLYRVELRRVGADATATPAGPISLDCARGASTVCKDARAGVTR